MARLDRETVFEILVAHNRGEDRSVIAKRHNIDVGTVDYHVEKHERVYGSTSVVYALIKPVQSICQHPSTKCTICGKAQDFITRREREEITRLRSILSEHGIDPDQI